jgi:CubicO group peptidase (beta-lactamase class C family)
MKKGIFGLLVAWALTGLVHAQPSPVTSGVASSIGTLIEPQDRAHLFSGVVLVQRGDQVIFHRAYGFASWELSAANTEQTRFGIASITKPMTEALVSALVERRRLDLRAPVEQYLPGFPRGASGGKPTIEQLVKHTAGVPHRVTTEAEEMQPFTAAQIVGRVKARGLLFEPGSQELYSSAGYTCLARVIEVIEGRSFDEALAQIVFKPARMTSSSGETGTRLMADRALPHKLVAGKSGPVVEAAPHKDLRFLTGAGSVYATPADLVAFARTVRSGGFGQQLQERARAGEKDSWRGWYGRTNGYEASVDLLPARDLIVVMVSNLQSAANWQLRQRIQNLLADRPVLPIPLPPARAERFEAPSDVVGFYGDPADPIEVAIRDGELSRDGNQVYPVTGARYYIPASGAMMRFLRQNGSVDAIGTIFDGGTERVLRKVPARGDETR